MKSKVFASLPHHLQQRPLLKRWPEIKALSVVVVAARVAQSGLHSQVAVNLMDKWLTD